MPLQFGLVSPNRAPFCGGRWIIPVVFAVGLTRGRLAAFTIDSQPPYDAEVNGGRGGNPYVFRSASDAPIGSNPSGGGGEKKEVEGPGPPVATRCSNAGETKETLRIASGNCHRARDRAPFMPSLAEPD